MTRTPIWLFLAAWTAANRRARAAYEERESQLADPRRCVNCGRFGRLDDGVCGRCAWNEG